MACKTIEIMDPRRNAIMNNDVEELKKSLKGAGYDDSRKWLNVSLLDGRTLLQFAIKLKKPKIVNLLLKESNERTKPEMPDRHTLLTYGVIYGNVEVVRNILAYYERMGNTQLRYAVNEGDGHQGITPLMYAAAVNKDIVTELLTVDGVDVNRASKEGNTALMTAVESKEHNVVSILLDVDGVNVDAVTNKEATPLAIAVMIDDSAIIKMLLEKGANWRHRYGPLENTILMLAAIKNKIGSALALLPVFKKYEAVDATNTFGKTALYHATSSNMVRILTQSGADANLKSHIGMTPLMIALEADENIDLISALINVSRLVEKNVSGKFEYVCDTTGESVMDKATKNDTEGVVQLLETAKTDIENNKFLVDAQQQEWNNVRKYVRQGADLTSKDRQGNTVLMLAAKDDLTYYFIQEFIQNNVHATNNKKESALLIAVRNKAVKIVPILTKSLMTTPTTLTDPSILSKPLHEAIRHTQIDMIKEILGVLLSDVYNIDFQGKALFEKHGRHTILHMLANLTELRTGNSRDQLILNNDTLIEVVNVASRYNNQETKKILSDLPDNKLSQLYNASLLTTQSPKPEKKDTDKEDTDEEDTDEKETDDVPVGGGGEEEVGDSIETLKERILDLQSSISISMGMNVDQHSSDSLSGKTSDDLNTMVHTMQDFLDTVDGSFTKANNKRRSGRKAREHRIRTTLKQTRDAIRKSEELAQKHAEELAEKHAELAQKHAEELAQKHAEEAALLAEEMQRTDAKEPAQEHAEEAAFHAEEMQRTDLDKPLYTKDEASKKLAEVQQDSLVLRKELENMVQLNEELAVAASVTFHKPTVVSSPTGDIPEVIAEIERATHKIDVCVYNIKSTEIAKALLLKYNAGVSIRILTDQENAQNEQLKRLKAQSVDIKMLGISNGTGGDNQLMHHKFSVIDKKTVLLGSANYTMQAVTNNYEAIMVLRGRKIAQDYTTEFDNLWNYAKDIPDTQPASSLTHSPPSP